MTILKKVFLVFAAGMIMVSFTACKKEGPAERAGKSIDETLGKTGDKIEEAGKKMQESINK